MYSLTMMGIYLGTFNNEEECVGCATAIKQLIRKVLTEINKYEIGKIGDVEARIPSITILKKGEE